MRFTVIGGLNGVGKSTIYSTLSDEEILALGKRINVDEIVSSLGDWWDIETQYTAGKLAVKEIKQCLNAGACFHQETTLAGRSILNTIKIAKSKGYSMHLWYIYVSNVEIAKQRVKSRVANGGHGIADDIIERRSITTLEGLKNVLPFCDEVRLYDNTTVFNPVARITNGKLIYLDKNIPAQIAACLLEIK